MASARASRGGALVLRGEAGIGKTALLEYAAGLADGMSVLEARGIESEAELPFGGLDQLLRPLLALVGRLPSPQAAALSRALGLEDGTANERFLVYAGCLSLLAEAAETAPVVCLVDDAHWLDPASAEALLFVARRLRAESIALLFAVRDDEARRFDARGVQELEIGPLDDESAQELLATRSTAPLEAGVRLELLERARGNALALVELPSALTPAQLAGEQALPQIVPLTREVERIFLERVRALPPGTRTALLVAAADDSEDVRLVLSAASRVGAGPGALDEAQQAGLLSVQGTRLEFRHPLIRAAAYHAATPGEQRAAHRALADALEVDEEQADRRAWHLVSSVLEPDDEIVQTLEEAAERAEERGGHVVAANVFERAAALSLDSDSRGRRLVAAARSLSTAGRNEQAVECALRAAPFVRDPTLLATLAQVRGLAAIRSGRPHEVVPVLVEAAREIATTDSTRAVTLLMDAAVAAWQGGDHARFLEIAGLAATVVPREHDDSTPRLIRSFAGFAGMARGETAEGSRLLREVVEWGADVQEPHTVLWTSFAAFWIGDAIRFGALVSRAAALSREHGELGTLADALGMRSTQLAFAQARFDDVTVAATEALALARELRAANLELLPRTALAIVAAIQGRDEEARVHGEEVLAFARANGLALRVSAAVYALALVDLARARWSAALERLESLAEAYGDLDPMVRATLPDRIEAAVRAGRPDEARSLLPLLEARADYSALPAARPRLEACRALLDEGAAATARFEEALELRADARPFDLARIHLLYGEHLRRERRRVDARVQLRAALQIFEDFRAEPWAERARAELRASGESARKRDPSTVDQLTAQELQIARMVGDGLSNKEVAAQLFLSPRTIDYHLRHVFSKLGITSRTQLARMLLETGEPTASSLPVA